MSKTKINQEIESIKNQLISKYQAQKIVLFGSAAKNADVVNDLDFFIIKQDVPISSLERARQIRRVVNKQMAADFIVLTPSELSEKQRMNDPMILNIINNGVVLYG